MSLLCSFFRFLYRLAKGLVFVVGLAVVALFLSILFPMKIGHYFDPNGEMQDTILVHTLKGPLSENTQNLHLQDLLQGSPLSLRDIIEALDHSAQNPRVKGIVMRLDQAHLGLAQVQELKMALHRFRATGKFALAHADTFGEMESGTGVYYLASAFSEIFLQPVGTLNLTGLAIEIPFIRKLLNQWDIVPRFGQRQEYKSVLETFTQDHMTDPSRQATQEVLQSIMDKMIQDISQEREIPVDELWQIVHQAPLSDPYHVQKLGLIDHVGPYTHAQERAKILAKSPTLHFMPLEHYPLPAPSLAKDKPRIALIYGSGTIVRTTHPWIPDWGVSSTMGSEHIRDAFDKALEDPQVKAIVFRINSGGGSVPASETIRSQVERAQKKGIPVVASFSDLAGSGGYWIATPATKIVAHPATITGSIGVVGGKLVLQGLWKKWGIEWDRVTVGSNATLSSPHVDYTPPQWQNLEQGLDYIYQQFLKRVQEGRHLPKEHVEQIAKGRIWSGVDALKYGLVDRLGDLQDAIALAKEAAHLMATEEVTLLTYPRPKTFWEKIRGFTTGQGFEDAWVSLALALSKGSLSSSLIQPFIQPPLSQPLTLSGSEPRALPLGESESRPGPNTLTHTTKETLGPDALSSLIARSSLGGLFLPVLPAGDRVSPADVFSGSRDLLALPPLVVMAPPWTEGRMLSYRTRP